VIASAILQGDIDRFSELLEKYKGLVYAIVARRVPADAVAIVSQDSFIRAYQSLSVYTGKVPFGNWVSRIAIWSCCAYWREQIRRRGLLVSPSPTQNLLKWIEQAATCRTEDESDQLVEQAESARILEWLLVQLSPEDRTLIESVYIEGRRLKEVASALEWSLVKTKVRAMRARRKMRRLLESIGESI
jgi:RNA polymerase sigma-70 factor (ECF subfamily)